MNEKTLAFSAVYTESYSKTSAIARECMFRLYYLKQMRVFISENAEVKVQVIINWETFKWLF
jgi:hypothetical protein